MQPSAVRLRSFPQNFTGIDIEDDRRTAVDGPLLCCGINIFQSPQFIAVSAGNHAGGSHRS